MSSIFFPCGVKNVKCNPVIITDPDTWTPPWLNGAVVLPELLAELTRRAGAESDAPGDLFEQVTRTSAYWDDVVAQLQAALDQTRPSYGRGKVYADFPGKTRRPALIHLHGRVVAQIGTPTEDAGAPRKAATAAESRAAREQVEAVLAQARSVAAAARRAELAKRLVVTEAALDAVRRLRGDVVAREARAVSR